MSSKLLLSYTPPQPGQNFDKDKDDHDHRRSRADRNYHAAGEEDYPKGTQQLWTLGEKDDAEPITRRPEDPCLEKLDEGYLVTTVGNYLLLYRLPFSVKTGEYEYVDYLLVDMADYLSGSTDQPVQEGSWDWSKFTGDYEYTAVPDGPQMTDLSLMGITGYVLHRLPTPGRSSFGLWNFDAYPDAAGGSVDPISTAMGDMSAFPNISEDDRLIPLGNYVVAVNGSKGTWRVFSFDPQLPNPLSHKAVANGNLPADLGRRIVSLGDQLLAWTPGEKGYTWFDASAEDPFANPTEGTFPDGFEASERTTLTFIDPRCQTIDPRPVKTKTPTHDGEAETQADVTPAPTTESPQPASIGFMREKIKHVVVYVLESRSFDSVVGYLYDKSNAGDIHWIGAGDDPVFKGASSSHSNQDAAGKTYVQIPYEGGAVGAGFNLTSPELDPFHTTVDTIEQQWKGGMASYQAGDAADMGGFVLNSGNAEVMETYSPDQLSVLNGLAQWYGLSDYWFCPEAGGTTTNRATLASGSAYNITMDYEGGTAYEYFPKTPHRQSMWKVLANNGIVDWAIYYSVLWENYPYTYHLYLQGELPSVDEYTGQYVQPIASFLDAAKQGTLPAFSFLEPVWFDPSGVFTSYHPTGNVLPGEQALMDIFDALSKGPKWDETALIISFSKGGGLYDHEPARKMQRAWPHDKNDGYGFDVTGARVPTLVVSPLVKKHTVFRSGEDMPFDATSIAATVLDWFGIPRWRWGLGDRVDQAPTLESVFTLEQPRTDLPELTRATDKTYPTDEPIRWAAPSPVSAQWAPPQLGEGVVACPTWNNKYCWHRDHWGNEHGADSVVPTDIATFGACEDTTVYFGFNDPQVVNEIAFVEGAPSYTLLFDEECPYTPILSIAGVGVTNASGKKQHFTVRATSVSERDEQLAFLNQASAGDKKIRYTVGPTTPESQSGGIVAFHQTSTAGSARFKVRVGARQPAGYATVGAEVRFVDYSNAGKARFKVYGTTGGDGDTFGNVVFHCHASAHEARFTNVGGTVGDGGNTQFYENATACRARITNKGSTGTNGNGGDTAFDGTATAGEATIINEAAKAGHGGVTSFNNNPPMMASTVGATAGNARITNQGTKPGEMGSGGHTEFTGIYGAGRGGNATIDNLGSENPTNFESGAGYTLFAVNGRWPKAWPSADNATITNYGGTVAGAQGGQTTFKFQNYDDDYERKYTKGPTAGWATIRNHGATVAGAQGGMTIFQDQSTASHANLSATAGADAAGAGVIRFADRALGDSASVTLEGGTLDVSQSTLSSLSFDNLTVNDGTVQYAIGGSNPMIRVTTLAIKSGQLAFVFTPAGGRGGTPDPVVLLEAPELKHMTASQFTGSMAGYTCTFTIEGEQLKVSFSAAG